MKRQALPVPYGLFIVLATYGVLLLGYVWATWWNSDEYLAAEDFQAGEDLLGNDDGQSASPQVLLAAYQHFLEAARRVPRVGLLHQRVEAMRWRLDARGYKLDPDLQMRAEAVAMLWQRLQTEQAPVLVVGARDRGWQPSQLLEGPTRSALYGLPGVFIIVIVWAWLRFSGRQVRAQAHEQELKALEAEVAATEAQRQRAARRGQSKTRR